MEHAWNPAVYREVVLFQRLFSIECSTEVPLSECPLLEGFHCSPQFSQVLSYFRKESETPILLDENEKALRLEERQKLFKEYRSSRQAMLDLRNEDRQRRNEAKVRQIELAEQWQVRVSTILHNIQWNLQ